MKTIVVSDIHLTSKFGKDKYDFLKKLFESCDKLIVDGDFWSCYSTTFDEFVNSEWKGLFPIMLAKKTLYIYGNHDRKEFMDQRVNLFSVEQNQRIKYQSGKNHYHIEHGHLFFKHQSISNSKFMELNRKLKVDERIRHPLEHFLYKTVGVGTLSRFLGYMNLEIKNKGKQLFQKGDILVVGHTHIPEDDKSLKFVNTGFIDHGLGWYMEIDEGGYKLVGFTY